MSHPTDNEWTENFTFEEISVGQSASLMHTLTLADIKKFACLAGGAAREEAVSSQTEYASASLQSGVVAHGMWSGMLISALLGTQFPGTGTLYQGQDLRFIEPVRVGDTLTVSATVVSKEATTRLVVLECQVNNQFGVKVVEGTARVLAPQNKLRTRRVLSSDCQPYDPQARFQALLALGKGLDPVRCAVVHPCDEISLRGAIDAGMRGLIIPVLIGPEDRIRAVAEQTGIDLHGVEIIAQSHSHAAADIAAELAINRDVEMLMKGSLHTDELLHAVVTKPGLRTGRRMSHVFRFDVPMYSKPLLITDAALNIRPGLADKLDIVQNAINFARILGVQTPKVALLAAVETVNPNMPSTLDAAALCKMADRGQITGGLLDGPLAFDNAISPEAAQIKRIKSDVAGQTDILAVPDLDSGNMLAKQLEYLAGASGSGIVLGARVPIALTSRAEGVMNRVSSALLSLLVAHNARRGQSRVVW
ncbi:bifunctional enoyl-CoA hydratase/phosphate acetyltransferase [Candidatus Symbiobacter mobilis]|uniref:Phosphate acetyltransferase n=1 Tax=Candidatus Symbiobacter mobilis CR TaxID=946483 RepID=U5N670_9BURK|nr:bifunctional enoyl-CoA hydratase/phosphate acetyltransferase [Candidatus Symbiobacter mobilis]AGX87011.1 phosphate acetyltransferase [Candidatus Symbiobacter mobilis CR]